TPKTFNIPGPKAAPIQAAGFGEGGIGAAAAALATAAAMNDAHAASGGAPTEVVPVAVVVKAADQVGDPKEAHRKYAAALVESLPPLVRDSVHEPYGARAVLFGLLADKN